jgi:hypothetical protein
MTLFGGKFRIESARHVRWDYQFSGYYFVTICTGKRVRYFGSVVMHRMILSDIGKIARSELLKTPGIRSNVVIDEWVIMPDHIHVVFRIFRPLNDPVNTDRTVDTVDGVDTGNAVDTHNVVDTVDGVDTGNAVVETHRGASLPIAQPATVRNLSVQTATVRNPTGQPPGGPNRFGPQSDNLAAIVRGFKSAVKKRTNIAGMEFHWQARYHDHIIRNDDELRRIRWYVRKNEANWGKKTGNR